MRTPVAATQQPTDRGQEHYRQRKTAGKPSRFERWPAEKQQDDPDSQPQCHQRMALGHKKSEHDCDVFVSANYPLQEPPDPELLEVFMRFRPPVSAVQPTVRLSETVREQAHRMPFLLLPADGATPSLLTPALSYRAICFLSVLDLLTFCAYVDRPPVVALAHRKLPLGIPGRLQMLFTEKQYTVTDWIVVLTSQVARQLQRRTNHDKHRADARRRQ